MAVTTDDFNKIWASTSPLTPYSFSDSQYKEGWNFIGSTPPSRQMWDFLQKNNDEKMQYLLNHFDNYLPLSGGTLTGRLTVSNGQQIKFAQANGPAGSGGWIGSTGTGLRITSESWSIADAPGVRIEMNGKNYATNQSQLDIVLTDSTQSKTLTLRPDGTLTWDNKGIERVSAKGTYGIRFESGIQICWGELTIPAGTSGRDVSGTMTFPYPFANTNYVLTFGNDWRSSSTEYYRAEGRNTENFKFTAVGVNTNPHKAFYLAIGYWK